MNDCQYVSNGRRNEEEEDDDDDFEDDDSEPTQSTIKVSNYAKLVCAMKTKANDILKDKKETLKHLLVGKIEQITSGARDMAYYVFDELAHSKTLLCSGIELRQPQARLERGKFVFRAQKTDDYIKIDHWCDDSTMENFKHHPESIELHAKQPEFTDLLKE